MTLYPILDRSVRLLIQGILDQHSQLPLSEAEEIVHRHLRRPLEVAMFLHKNTVPSWMHIQVEHDFTEKETVFLEGVLARRMPVPWKEIGIALKDLKGDSFDLRLVLRTGQKDLAIITRSPTRDKFRHKHSEVVAA
ncbi:MAG: hypothetical protein KW793_02760 [Candidatus Doudnabacteria bacterium]|nr:hypothetical protein [Candidatus Doudnabacteria bacterium]